MESSFLNMFHTLPTAKEIWDAVNQMFYDGSDISQLYELRCQATRLKQEGRPVATYFAELKAIQLELTKRRPFQMKCANDMKTFQAAVMTDRVYDFLAGLDDTYDKVRSDILQSDKVPSIENVFFYGSLRGSMPDYYAWIRHQDWGIYYCVCFQKHCSGFSGFMI